MCSQPRGDKWARSPGSWRAGYPPPEFERDLLRELVRSGIATAHRCGVVFGRRPGQRVKADRFAPKVLKLVSEGQSYREISHRLGLSKNTVVDIVKRDRVP